MKHIRLGYNTREALHLQTNALNAQKPTRLSTQLSHAPSAILDKAKDWERCLKSFQGRSLFMWTGLETRLETSGSGWGDCRTVVTGSLFFIEKVTRFLSALTMQHDELAQIRMNQAIFTINRTHKLYSLGRYSPLAFDSDSVTSFRSGAGLPSSQWMTWH